MLRKITAGLILALFLSISSGISVGLLSQNSISQGQVLGEKCLPERARCRRDSQCCSGRCVGPFWAKKLPWYPGRCQGDRENLHPHPGQLLPKPTVTFPVRPSRPPKPPTPTRIPTKPPRPPVNPPQTSNCSQQLKSICQNLPAIKSSLQSLTKKVDSLYQKCREESPKPTTTPKPTRGAKKCGVRTFNVSKPSPENPRLFGSVYAVCYDGFKFTKKNGYLTAKQWRQEAERACQEHCSSDLKPAPLKTIKSVQSTHSR